MPGSLYNKHPDLVGKSANEWERENKLSKLFMKQEKEVKWNFYPTNIYNAMQCNAIQHNTTQQNITQYNTVFYKRRQL